MSISISVYITSFNQKDFLEEAIKSVLNQTRSVQQIIIVDDASTDASQELISGYAARHPDLIQPIFNERNLGVADSRNLALKAVQSSHVAYLDGDDRYLPRKIELEARMLESNSAISGVFSNFYFITADGKQTQLWDSGKTFNPQNLLFKLLALKLPRNAVFRNELLEQKAYQALGYLDGHLITHEDWDIKIRLASQYHFGYESNSLSEYRRHPHSLSHLSALIRGHNIFRVYKKNQYLHEQLSSTEVKQIRKRMKLILKRLLIEALPHLKSYKDYQSFSNLLYKLVLLRLNID